MTTDEAVEYASCILGAPSGKTEETVVVLAAEVRRLREYVAEIDDEAVEAVGTPSEYNNGELQWHGRYTQLWRLIARMKRAEADLATSRAEITDLQAAINTNVETMKLLREREEAARAEVARLRAAIEWVLDSPGHMGSEDIDRLLAALEGR